VTVCSFLLFGVATGATLISVLLPLLLALLTGGKVGGNVQEFPSGAWALASYLMDQLLAGGSHEEHSDDISASNIG
jgi:hypothetical protein